MQTQVKIQSSFRDSSRRRRKKNEATSKEHGNLYSLGNLVPYRTLKHTCTKHPKDSLGLVFSVWRFSSGDRK